MTPNLQRLIVVAAITAVVVAAIGLATRPGSTNLGTTAGAPTPSPVLSSNPPSHAASAATSSPAPTDSATVSPSASSAGTGLLAPTGYSGNGTIVFTRPIPGASGVSGTWLVNPSGAGETPLKVKAGFGGRTDLPGSGCCGVFSPDGQQLAVAFDDLVGAGSSTLVRTAILRLDGTLVGVLPVCGACAYLDGLNYAPQAWSSDGRWLAVQVWSDADPTRNGIYLIDVGHKSAVGWKEQVTGRHDDTAVAFSPDGSQLLFVRTAANADHGPLMVLDIAAGTTRQLTPKGVVVYANGYFGGGASWSPDGSKIAYAGTDGNGDTSRMRVFVEPAAGGAATPIAGPAPFITSAHWSPDGQWIAYDEPTTGSGVHNENIVHPDGSGNRSLPGPAGLCCSRWSPDGAALVAIGTVSRDDQSYLFVIPVDGSPVWQVTTVPGMYEDVAWGSASR